MRGWDWRAATASRCCSATAIEFALTMFAAAHAGLVTVLLSTRQQKPEIAYVLTDCGAKLLIHEATHADRMPDARDVPDLQHRISVDDGGTSQFAALLDHAPSPRPPKSAKRTPR